MTLTRARNEFENALAPREFHVRTSNRGCLENSNDARARARDTFPRRFTIDHVKVILRRASRRAPEGGRRLADE